MPPSWKLFSRPQETEQCLRNAQQQCIYPHWQHLTKTATAKAWVDAVPFRKETDLWPGSATRNQLVFVKNIRSLVIYSTEATCHKVFKLKENAEVPTWGQRGSEKKQYALKLNCLVHGQNNEKRSHEHCLGNILPSTLAADEKHGLDKRPEADVDEEGLTRHDLTYHPLVRPSLLA